MEEDPVAFNGEYLHENDTHQKQKSLNFPHKAQSHHPNWTNLAE